MTASDNPVTAAVAFLQSTLAGSVATAAAVLAIAGVGFLMLSGRLEARRSVVVIFGCFIIFGAATIAAGIESAIFGSRETAAFTAPPPSPERPTTSPPAKPAASAYDPYAGAAVPRQ